MDQQPAVRHGWHRGGPWVRVTRGVQRRVDAPEPFLADLHAWQSTFRPTMAFTHLTSARLRDWWLPPLPDWLPVFVGMSAAINHPRRPGLDVTRRVIGPEYDVLRGLRVATPAETIIAAADDLGTFDLAILVVSALRAGAVTIAELEPLARQHRRGAPRLRTALEHVDERYESPMELLLGSLHRMCGITVDPQREIFDADGRFVARADLWLVGTRSVHEYDGAHHLDRAQQGIDLRRLRRLDDAGFSRRGYNADDLLHQPQSILQDADRAVGRPHDPRRTQPWLELLEESLYTASGHRRLRKRLKIPTEN